MGILSIDLRKLVKDYDGKQMNMMFDEDGSKASDEKAREVIANYIAEGYTRIPMRTEKLPDTTPEKDNSRLKRLKEKLAELQRQRLACFSRGIAVKPLRLIDAKIAAVEDEIKECEAYLPKELSKQIDRETMCKSGLAEKMIKMHIAADYLTETAMVLREALDDLGFINCNVFPFIEQIEQRAASFAAIVCHPEFAGLSHFMTTNEKMIDDLDTIVNRYLRENMKLTN